jgi:hypothetical protein
VTDYCTWSEANTLAPSLVLGASTVPTETVAGTYPRQISAEIDALLQGLGYKLPITDPVLLAGLKSTCRYGVAALALQAKFGKDEETARYWKRYSEGLDTLRSREESPAGVAAPHLGEGFTDHAHDRRDRPRHGMRF